MPAHLPYYIPLFFILTTIVTFWLLIGAAIENNTDRTIFIISSVMFIWLVLQGFLAENLFYISTDSMPPRILLAVGPPLFLILLLFIFKRGRRFIDSLSLKVLTILHTVRIFVEIVLWWLFLYKYVPQLMTFEGRNFDIFAGLTAPFVAYSGFVKGTLGKGLMLIWNIVSLLLLLNIVINAILSAPFPFQQFGFDQPNVAILYFPFIWLPAFIVPAVLFSHVVLIRRLLKEIQRF